MNVSEGTQIPVAAVEAAFKDFYAYLTDSEHFSAYFHSQAQIDRLVEKQKQSFIYSLKLDEKAFAEHYRMLGRLHADIGVTIEDLISGLKIIRDKLLKMEVLSTEQIYDFIERIETHLAHGYLDYELDEMLGHARLVLKNAPDTMPDSLGYVVEWFIQLAEAWRKDIEQEVPISAVESCPFSETISHYVQDETEQYLLHKEHKLQHVMASSCQYFLHQRDYMLANFLLVRLFSISVGLFNRLLSVATMEQLAQAKRDPLTGLRMRHDMDVLLFRIREKSRKQGAGFGVLMLDLDHFKHINDDYGHDMGDAVLKQVGRLLQQLVRDDDVVIRYGGEEIVVFLPAISAETLFKVAERIRHKIEETPVFHNGNTLKVTASIGCLYIPFEQLAVADEILMKQVDAHLYQAKHGGRNQVVCASLETGFTSGN